MKLHIENRVFFGFITTVVVLIALGVISFTSTQRQVQSEQLLSHATQIISYSEQMIKTVVDIETGQRGYVITGSKTFLEPFDKSFKDIYPYLNKLDSLTTNSASQQKRVNELRRLIKAKLNWSRQVIEARGKDFEKARDLVISGEGKGITDSIRTLIRSMQDEEKIVLRKENAFLNQHLWKLQYSYLGLALAVLIIVVYLFYTINSMLKKRSGIEAQLKKVANETKDLYENAPCGYLSVDATIHLSSINNTLLTWLGYGRDEVIGKMKFEDLLSMESREKFLSSFKEDFDRYKTKGSVADLEFEFQRKDGTIFPVTVNSSAILNEYGEFTGSRTTVFDNTLQKRTNEKFKGLLEAAPDASVIVGEDGVIKMVNKQCQNIFGYTREELIGEKVELLMADRYKEIHPQHREKFFSKPAARPMGVGLELFGLRKSGEEFPVEISLSPITTDDGLLISASIRDITQRKRSEDLIKNLNQELESFTYSVSHDLRAPLRSINGYAQILKEDFGNKLDNEGNRLLDVIVNNANRMGQLIDDLLDFSRLGRKELNSMLVDMDELVRMIVQELTPQNNGRQLNIQVQPLAPSHGDISMLRQVWINLISNAIKYSSKKEVSKIEIGSQIEKDSTCYYILDNGAGFDMQYVNKLFGVFQRLHKMNEFEGTGVGLALVKTIIVRHGGRVWAEGKPEEGAKFYFTIPTH